MTAQVNAKIAGPCSGPTWKLRSQLGGAVSLSFGRAGHTWQGHDWIWFPERKEQAVVSAHEGGGWWRPEQGGERTAARVEAEGGATRGLRAGGPRGPRTTWRGSPARSAEVPLPPLGLRLTWFSLRCSNDSLCVCMRTDGWMRDGERDRYLSLPTYLTAHRDI